MTNIENVANTFMEENDKAIRAKLRMVKMAIRHAITSHGPLTSDRFRAYTILQEEAGEVARSLLESRRSEANGLSSEKERQNAVLELMQVAAICILLSINLEQA